MRRADLQGSPDASPKPVVAATRIRHDRAKPPTGPRRPRRPEPAPSPRGGARAPPSPARRRQAAPARRPADRPRRGTPARPHACGAGPERPDRAAFANGKLRPRSSAPVAPPRRPPRRGHAELGPPGRGPEQGHYGRVDAVQHRDGIAVLQPRVGVPPKTPDRFTRGGLFLPAAGMPRDVGAAGRSRRRSMEGGFPGPPGPAPGRVPRPRGRSEASTDALDWDPHPARVDTQTSPRAEPRSGLGVGSGTLTLPDHGAALARMAGSKRMTG